MTTAVISSRSSGACRNIYDTQPVKCFGPRPISAGLSVTLTSCMAHSPTATRLSCMKANPWALLMPARSGASSRSTKSERCLWLRQRFEQSSEKILVANASTGQNLEHFRTLFVAGERCDPDTLEWAGKHLHVPVIDHWWQTETGWPVGANMAGPNMLPIKPGSCGVPMPGYDVRVVDDECKEVSANTTGNVVIKLPMPPGCLLTLWNNDAGCQESYFNSYPGYYKTGDAGFKDDDGYLWIMGRTDDIINVAGHRLSTGGMEEVIAAHPDVAECAVIGKADAVKGEVPLGLVVLKAGTDRSEAEIVSEVVAMVRERIGPVASFKAGTSCESLT